jgi:NADH-quinone oxidoreductase subunit N
MLTSEFDAIVPMLCVTLAALVSMLAEAFREKDERMPMAVWGLIGLTGSVVSSALLWNRAASGFGVIVADNFGIFVTVTLAVVGALTLLFSAPIVERDGLPAGEYYALVLFAIVGMMMMATARDLLVIFVALEILSLAVYVLTSIRRDNANSTEAAFKYFLLGAFSSAFFLYGIAFTYGVTGSTRLPAIGSYLAAQSMSGNPLILVALGLLLVGFCFKISAVPFHMWTPDAYEGAPAVVTGFMSTGVKAAAFAAFVRVFLSAFEPFKGEWAPVLAGLAVATMVLGTVVGVAQSNLKRMLAYSSIAHAGYLMVGLIAANTAGKSAILVYLVAYAVTNLGAFGVLAALSTADRPHDDVRDFAGLWQDRPGLAALLTVFLLSLGGFPPTAGFVAKWYIFNAALQEQLVGLAILGVLTSVVSVFFYLRIVVQMYMTDDRAPGHRPAVPKLALAGMLLALVAVFYFGVLPGSLLRVATDSVASIF